MRPNASQLLLCFWLAAGAIACKGTERSGNSTLGGSVAASSSAPIATADVLASRLSVTAAADSLDASVSRGDVGGMMRYYEPQAAEFAQEPPMLHGATAIRDYYADEFRRSEFSRNDRDTHIDVRGDTAVEDGEYTREWTVRSDPRKVRMRSSGHALTVWRRSADGRWKVWRRMLISSEAGAVDPSER